MVNQISTYHGPLRNSRSDFVSFLAILSAVRDGLFPLTRPPLQEISAQKCVEMFEHECDAVLHPLLSRVELVSILEFFSSRIFCSLW